MRIVYLVFTLGLLTSVVFAQEKLSTTCKAAISNFETASDYIDQHNLKKAIVELHEATLNDDKFIEAYMLLADVYRADFDYMDSKLAYQKAYEINPNYAPERYFYFAETELKTGEYLSAKKHFLKFLSVAKEGDKNFVKAQKHIKDCDFSLMAIKNPVPFKPVNLGSAINTVDDEYMAAITTDESNLIFTRQINNKEDFYQSFKVDTTWSKAVYLSKNINTDDFNEGAQCISPDGQYLFFTGCNRPDGLGRCDIYISKKDGKEWSKPIDLGFPINTKGWESQPSVSSDGKTLYFVSDRKGGYGGYDIWKSNLNEKGSWGEPVNLGPNINTAYDDMSPFIHPDNKTLYFSSDGWVGLGNKDIFISRLDDNNQWSVPQNMGYPINTCHDEGGLTINASGTKAYFSSDNYNGFGGLDLYSFEILPKNIKPIYTNYVKGNVYDSQTKKALEADIQIFDLKTGKTLLNSYSNTDDGSFLTVLPQGSSFALNVSANGYLYYSESFDATFHKVNEPVILNIPLNKLEIGKNVILKNIYFENNKFDLKPESKAELKNLIEFLTLNPKVSISIHGFTDNVGEDQSNLSLSENRAKTVYKYLINSGIKENRLKYTGFGKTKPITENSTEAGRARNRRTEFMIIGL
jgi:outer membrane protein OmpA-like peptidoglycan-associated protein/Tol biopolymer transport system component